jgi:hypothetical protein
LSSAALTEIGCFNFYFSHESNVRRRNVNFLRFKENHYLHHSYFF